MGFVRPVKSLSRDYLIDMEDFILRALAASLGVSVIAGSLGCFVIWKRLSYFSDSISHSALLGVA